MTDQEIIEFLETRLSEAVRSRDFSQEWYSSRFDELRALCKTHGFEKEACDIIANGSLMHQKDTVMGIIMNYKHRAEGVEKGLDELVNAIDKHMDEFYGPAHDDKNLQWKLREAKSALTWYRKDAKNKEIE